MTLSWVLRWKCSECVPVRKSFGEHSPLLVAIFNFVFPDSSLDPEKYPFPVTNWYLISVIALMIIWATFIYHAMRVSDVTGVGVGTAHRRAGESGPMISASISSVVDGKI